MTSLNFGNFSRKIKNRRSFICGIKGISLSKKEIFFLKKYKPWGIILFTRNIKNINQTSELSKSIRKIFQDNYFPIIVDEEGGRVSRFKKIFDNSILTSKFFGDLYLKDKKKFDVFINVYVSQITNILKQSGININSVPVLDINRKNYHKIIGDRSFSSSPKIISEIGNLVINKCIKNNVLTIIKHIPGHGLSKEDSHKSLPVITKKLNYLLNNDFKTFKDKQSLLAMTAHILFKDIDSLNCATHSKKIIKIIRNKIGFKNILMTDDISMKALKYSLKTNTKKAFDAGCNIVLHCNANLSEMKIVAENSPFLSTFIIKKTSQIYKKLS